jgi:trigger factor
VKTEVKPVAENEVELAVEVPRDDVEAKVERTISRLSRETTIPGFRKGKVPRQIVLSRLGEEYVLNQTLNDFLPEWYESAVDEAELDPVSVPEIDFEFSAFTGKEPFAFTAKVQVRPEPMLGQYTGLEVEKDEVEITEGQIDAQLAMLQERFASLKPVEGRAVVMRARRSSRSSASVSSSLACVAKSSSKAGTIFSLISFMVTAKVTGLPCSSSAW